MNRKKNPRKQSPTRKIVIPLCPTSLTWEKMNQFRENKKKKKQRIPLLVSITHFITIQREPRQVQDDVSGSLAEKGRRSGALSAKEGQWLWSFRIPHLREAKKRKKKNRWKFVGSDVPLVPLGVPTIHTALN